MATDEFIKDIEDNYFIKNSNNKISVKTRVQFNEVLFKLCNLDLNEEQLRFITCNYLRQIDEACAGSGKTTSTVLKVFSHIMFDDIMPETTVMLTYTDKAMRDVKSKMDKLFFKLENIQHSLIKPVKKFKVKTIHSFQLELINEYSSLVNAKVDHNGKVIVSSENQLLIYMSIAIRMFEESTGKDLSDYKDLNKKIRALYCNILERDILSKKELWSLCPQFKILSDIGTLNLSIIINNYIKIKNDRNSIEYSEFANLCIYLLNDDRVRERWFKLYRTVVVDEYQDLTESQLNMLKVLFNSRDDGMLVAIGDGDQSIYGFRGSHTNGCYNFENDFKTQANTPIATTLTLNRRCPEIVIDKSRQLIESTTNRRYKNVIGRGLDGNIEILYSQNCEEESNMVLDRIKDFTIEELSETVICYRNNRSRRYIKYRLEEEGYLAKDDSNLEDIFESNLKSIINLMMFPYSPEVIKNELFKVIPKSKDFGKSEIRTIVEREEAEYLKKSRMFETDFYNLDFSVYKTPAKFEEAIQMLGAISRVMRDKTGKYGVKGTMSVYMPILIEYLRIYYLGWQDKQKSEVDSIFDSDGKIRDEYSQMIYNLYTQPITYEEFIIAYKKREDRLKNSKKIINLSTFHRLKGLEFDNVIIIDLKDNIFPAYEIREVSEFGEEFINQADNEAKRLFYVAITRTKKNLIMIFNKSMPTRYLAYINDYGEKDISDELSKIDLSLVFTDKESLFEIDDCSINTTDEFNSIEIDDGGKNIEDWLTEDD